MKRTRDVRHEEAGHVRRRRRSVIGDLGRRRRKTWYWSWGLSWDPGGVIRVYKKTV